MRLRIRTGASLAVAIGAAVAALAGGGAITADADARTTVAPRNTAPPTITGQPRQTRTLTATNGTWENSPTQFTYQWQRCNMQGAACTAINGATRNTYALVAADVDNTVRVLVTASNADGQATANSAVTQVISSNTPPRNTARPTITGQTVVGNELTANNGNWTGGVRSFAYQWQRCDDAGANCAAISGATGRTYGVRVLDIGSTLRVEVTARNDAGTQAATSDRTTVVRAAGVDPPPPPPPPPPTANERPRITLLSARIVGNRVRARVRICDDGGRNVTILERDSKAGVRSRTRRFQTATPPNPCGVYTRNWAPARHFLRRGPGSFVVSLWARDAQGRTSGVVRRNLGR